MNHSPRLIVLFVLSLTLPVVAAEPKHKRGEGLVLPPKTSKLPSPKRPPTVKTGITKKTSGKTKKASPHGRPIGAPGEAVTERPPAPTEKKSCVPLPLERLFKLPRPESPQISSHGVFYLDGAEDDRQIYEQTGPTAKPIAISSIDGGIRSFRASGDGKSLAAIPNQTGGLWIWSESDRKLEEVALPEAAKAESAAWSADGAWLAFAAPGTGSDFLIYRFELAERKLSLLATLNGRHRVEDISPDGKALALRHLSSDLQSEELVWFSDGKPLLRFSEPVASDAPPAVFSAASDGIFFQSGISESRLVFGALTGAVKPISEMDVQVEAFGLDARRDRLVFSRDQASQSEWAGWEVSENGTKGRRLVVPDNAGLVAGAPAVEKSAVPGKVGFFFIRSTGRRPEQLWRWGGSREELWTPLPDAEKSEGCWPSASAADIDEAKTLRGYTYFPKDASPKTPFIVLVRAQGFRPHFLPQIVYLTQRGFGVLAVSADSAADAAAAARWLAKKKLAAPRRTFLIGEVGTPAAMEALKITPAVFRDGVVLADSTLETYRQAVVRFETVEKEKGPQ